jgi:hypothetical protein
MDAHVVVASHEENLHWFPKVNLGCPITILNCGKFQSSWWHVYNQTNNQFYIESEKLPSVKVPNAGLEAGMYLQYIIKNYKNLPERMIFIQADLGVGILIWSRKHEICKHLEQKISNIKKCKSKMRCFTPEFDLVEEVPIFFPKHEFVFSEISKKHPLPEKTIAGFIGAQFYVDRVQVLKNTIEYYQDIYNLHKQRLSLAHDLEYVWPALFQVEPK